MKHNLLTRFLILIALVVNATALATPLAKKHKFPYIGTWQGGMAAAPAYGSRLSFNQDGSCSYVSISPRWNNPHECSYVMKGSQALLITKMSDKDGTISRFRDFVFSQNKGRTLTYKPIDVTGLRANGKSFYYHRFTDPAYILRKVK